MNLTSLRRHLSYLLLLSFVFTFSCRLKVPIKEMTLAKATMKRAVELKADKYAPEELKGAEENLYRCHEELKKEELDKAKELAKKSLNLSPLRHIA